MALKIVWTRNAIGHLEDILNYWESRNGTSVYSIKLYKLFQNGLDVLSRYPFSGTSTNNDLIRKKTIRDYFIYYSYNESNLTVLGIVDMRRNPKFIRKFEE
ncbi:MAG TPA: type II toxin-antitoxin system RelE/ParE family toxin [Saprospiraceae bacterium]|nr:type II toxin-antitoxin system RelE/ParE family toxin [Saprospiraceae bacterium]HMU02025.1 type II toxin-antitoxin system RelE/ParE family toxin [Saprospiraceae bacterium]